VAGDNPAVGIDQDHLKPNVLTDISRIPVPAKRHLLVWTAPDGIERARMRSL
jgi:hypothetical protein